MKRTKQASSYRSNARDGGDDGPFSKPAEPQKSWAEQMEGKTDEQFAPYALTSKFDKGALIAHPKFGKGVVIGVEGQRIEVLFEEGPKKLGHAG